jgi:hypothetical protein
MDVRVYLQITANNKDEGGAQSLAAALLRSVMGYSPSWGTDTPSMMLATVRGKDVTRNYSVSVDRSRKTDRHSLAIQGHERDGLALNSYESR